MAVQNFANAYVVINSINLSDHVENVKLEIKADMLETTAMSFTEHRFIAGLKDWSFEVTFYQDYAAGSVDATLWALVGAAAFTFELRPDAGAVAVSNPKFTGSAVFEGFEPISGGVGTLQKVTAKFKPASALARATS